MAKIKDCVVIDINFINQLVDDLTEEIIKCDNKRVWELLSTNIKIIRKIKSVTKPLEPIISKSWEFESQKMQLQDYLENTEV